MDSIFSNADDGDAAYEAMYPTTKPTTNPFYMAELARPDSELNRSGVRKPHRRSDAEHLAAGIRSGRLIDMRRRR